MMTPPVTVLMPVFNAERFIAQTIETVLAQTFRDFEFLIIDDGSTDASAKIVRDYEARDARIRFISRSNRGLVATLNEGLAIAQGNFIARIDADDLCDPHRLELQLERMRSEPRLVALGSCAAAMDESGEPLGDYSVPLTHEEIEVSHLSGSSAIHHPAVMLRKDAVRNAGGYRDLMPCEDYDLWLRLGEIGQLANLPQRLITKRLLAGSTIATSLEKQRVMAMRVLSSAWKRRGLKGEPTLPQKHLQCRADLFRQWGWMALKAGHVRTSRRYALKALKARPLEAPSWKLAACALRGK